MAVEDDLRELRPRVATNEARHLELGVRVQAVEKRWEMFDSMRNRLIVGLTIAFATTAASGLGWLLYHHHE